MTNLRILSIVFVLACTLNAKAWEQRFDHSLWQSVLQQFLSESGAIDYAGIRADRANLLSAYVNSLEQISPQNRPELFAGAADELAYWLNAYNALTIKSIAEAYPVESVRDIGPLRGSFRNLEHLVGGHLMTLNDIELRMIHKRFHDLRTYFAVSYGAVGSPAVLREAFLGSTLDAQLDHVVRRFLNDGGMSIEPDSGRVILSRVFAWRQKDFEQATRIRGSRALIAFVTRYAGVSERKQLRAMRETKVELQEYDWTLNDSRRSAASPTS